MKITKQQLTAIIKEELRKSRINEAESVEFEKLPPAKQKQIGAIEKAIGGKRTNIWDGIHGTVVEIKTSHPGNYRLDADTMKKLLSAKVRWAEPRQSLVWVGF